MGWSDKYKKSIDCNNPKGFSQKAHCAGRKKRENTMKLSELKNIVREILTERSINAISKSQGKNAENIAKALELYKKVKNDKGSNSYKKAIGLLKKLNDEKKKLAKEMDIAVSSKMRNVGYAGPLDQKMESSPNVMELLGAFLTGVVGPILYLLVSKQLQKEKDKKRDKVKETIVNTALITEEIEEIREEFESCRVWISQFHNGGNFYPTGKSIQKFSIFYEVTKPGTSSVSHIFNNIPCSLYPHAFNHMLNDEQKGIFIPDFKDPKVATYGLKGAADSVGTKSSYVIPMFTLDDKFIGSLGVDFVSRKKKLTKDQWEHLQIKAGRIAGYLSSHLAK